ncbi:Xaa-Pro aminopeptidase [Alkalimonas amylolytica]|uniref:Xaa-Pro aminopeptidase n=1 Tax=Alkalimonas amylolytica TaxID=152573 RepID=A0A1H4EUP6_ALKAM|nr:Xaa-Pro aminopeptidase [Alkalimonas amylolytica]SEA88721.1 Xaa-Pro aminopeptidase [Alkalimonas amylolytica]
MNRPQAERRQRLLAELAASSVAVIAAGHEQIRSRDTDYPFRSNSDFWYLTGFPEPEALLILTKDAAGHCSELLVCRDKDAEKEVWQGRRFGPEQAEQQFGIAAASVSEQQTLLLAALKGKQQLWFCFGDDEALIRLLNACQQQIRTTPRQSELAPQQQCDLRPLLSELRLFKDEHEISLMQQAASMSAGAHKAAMQLCQPGMQEYQLEACIQYHCAMLGARHQAYNAIVGGGENACILHYTENNAELRDGDLVLIDAGCELMGYAADITRTFPVNGRFSKEQAALYQLVLDAQLAALAEIKPGSSFALATQACYRVLTEGLHQLGILHGELSALIEAEAAKPWMIHSLGHWLGLDVHDVGAYQPKGSLPEPGAKNRPFEPGMVLTVEPGLYIPKGSDTDPKWWGIGIRIEDDVLVTAEGHRNLTAAVPKTIAEIEALMAAGKGKEDGQFD